MRDPRSSDLLRWAPRVLGIAVCLFLGLFALDAFGAGQSLARQIGDFGVHLIPAAVLLCVVALAWRWEWVGGVAFTVCAVAYSVWAREHPLWVVTIAGPLFVVGLLFLWSWRFQRRSQRTVQP